MDCEQDDPEAACEATDEPTRMSFIEFLESVPPNQTRDIADLKIGRRPGCGPIRQIISGKIRIHCSNVLCDGLRMFEQISVDPIIFPEEGAANLFLTYQCANCGVDRKLYCLSITMAGQRATVGKAVKLGEHPPFGPPTQKRLLNLVGRDLEMFHRGRRCEVQGLGIGAFGYYRRVVESQKDHILGEIIKVSQTLGVPDDAIDRFRKAQKETQFTTALKMAQDGIPQGLLINGQNPLRLLHKALSDGLHARDDESCLALAQAVREVLGELANRMAQLRKENSDLKKALTLLAQNPEAN